MAERNETIESVIRYYDASEKGYWGYLGGRCHYGFTPEGDKGPFDMVAAQIEMERKLGSALALPPGSRVLDAGCGWGPVARTMTNDFGYEVTGIDLIERRLQGGKKINQQLNLPQIDLARVDYHDLPFEDASFDGVYTMETVVHADPLDRVLGEFKRVLKPGGRLAMCEYSIPDLNKVPKVPRMLAERVIKNTGMASLPQMVHGQWPNILENTGFTNVQVDEISKNVYPSWFYLWKFSIKNIMEEAGQGHIGLDSIPGSFWIWPARSKLGYNLCQASKPQS